MVNGPDGVRQIYPTKAGGTEFYLNQTDPYTDGGAYTSLPTGQFRITYGKANKFPFTTTAQSGSNPKYFNTTGSPISYASGSPSGRSTRLDIFPDGGWNADNTNYYYGSNPGYLYTAKGIQNGEFTVYLRGHGDLGSGVHHSCAGKVNGRDDDNIRSEIETVYPTVTHNTTVANFNYTHLSYTGTSVTHVTNPPILSENTWVGIKYIHIVAADKKSSRVEMWVDNSPFDSSGNPANNWVLAAKWTDNGNPSYSNIPCTWAGQKDTCRIDGFANVDFTLLSDRDVDAGQGVSPPTPTPAPVPNPTPGPSAQTNIRFGIAEMISESSTDVYFAASEEIIEDMTNPYTPSVDPAAWTNAAGDEICDACTETSSNYMTSGVPKKYSNGSFGAPYYSNSDTNCVEPGVGIGSYTGTGNYTNAGHITPISQFGIWLIFWGPNVSGGWSQQGSKGVGNNGSLLDIKSVLTNLFSGTTYASKLTQYGVTGTISVLGYSVDTTTPMPANYNVLSQPKIVIENAINNGTAPNPNSSSVPTFYLVIADAVRGQKSNEAPSTGDHAQLTVQISSGTPGPAPPPPGPPPIKVDHVYYNDFLSYDSSIPIGTLQPFGLTSAVSDIFTIQSDLGNQIPGTPFLSWQSFELDWQFNTKKTVGGVVSYLYGDYSIEMVCQSDGQNFFSAIANGVNKLRFTKVLPIVGHSYLRELFLSGTTVTLRITDTTMSPAIVESYVDSTTYVGYSLVGNFGIQAGIVWHNENAPQPFQPRFQCASTHAGYGNGANTAITYTDFTKFEIVTDGAWKQAYPMGGYTINAQPSMITTSIKLAFIEHLHDSVHNNAGKYSIYTAATEEIIEEATDPYTAFAAGFQDTAPSNPPLYHIKGDEICDSCQQYFDFQTSASLDTLTTSGGLAYPGGVIGNAYWSNSDNACILPGLKTFGQGAVPVGSKYTDQGLGGISQLSLVLIFWAGPQGWDQSATGVGSYQDVLNTMKTIWSTSYVSKLSQYGVNGISVIATYLDTTTPMVQNYDSINTSIAIVEKNIAAGNVPNPLDPNLPQAQEILYVVLADAGSAGPMGSGILFSGFVGIHVPVGVRVPQPPGLPPSPTPTPGGGGGGTPTPSTAPANAVYYALAQHINANNTTNIMLTISTQIVNASTDPLVKAGTIEDLGALGWTTTTFVPPNFPANQFLELCDNCTTTNAIPYSNGAIGTPYFSDNDGACVIPGIYNAKNNAGQPYVNNAGIQVLSPLNVFLIFWGNTGGTWNNMATGPGTYNDIRQNVSNLINQTPYFRFLQQYSVQSVGYIGSAINTITPMPSTYGDPTVQQVVIDSIKHGIAPNPLADVNPILFVVVADAIKGGKSTVISATSTLNKPVVSNSKPFAAGTTNHFWNGFDGVWPSGTISSATQVEDIITINSDLGNQIPSTPAISWCLYLLELFGATSSGEWELDLICQGDGQNYFEAIFTAANRFRFTTPVVVGHSYHRSISVGTTNTVYSLTDVTAGSAPEIYNYPQTGSHFPFTKLFSGIEWHDQSGANKPFPVRFAVTITQLGFK